MIQSIQHFSDVSVDIFQKLQEKFYEDPEDIASFVYGISDELRKLGLMMIKESLEQINRQLRESGVRKKHWVVEKNIKKSLLTSLGTIHFEKTLFTNRESGEMACLIDRILGLEPHARLTEDAEARLLEEAVQTSYQRGGEASTISPDSVSREAVKKRLHSLVVPNEWEKPAEKKVLDYLYIEADEDHISLQFREQKGDLRVGGNGRKNNTVIGKLIYVHEGIQPDGPRSKRRHLVNPHYFSDTGGGQDNRALWDQVYQYICDTYDVEKIKRIYLSADGGGWIKSGMKRIDNLLFVMDEFHLSKYMIRLTSHLKDSTEDARRELYQVLRHGTKDEFRTLVEKIRGCLPDETGGRRIDEAANYFLENWMPARRRLLHYEGVVGCSAEGHVSHVLSGRMSSRPMGWSTRGASIMAQLRVYDKNGGNMLDLVRRQRKPAAGRREAEPIYSCGEMLRMERQQQNERGKYIDRIQASILPGAAKYVHINKRIWDVSVPHGTV